MTKFSTTNSAGYIKITNAIKLFEESMAEFVQDINNLTVSEYKDLSNDLAGTRQNIEFFLSTMSSLYNEITVSQNKDPRK